MTFTQRNRLLSLDTPLGPDVLLLRAFTGHEALSQLFLFQLDLVSENLDIDLNALLGQQVTVGITLTDGRTRRFFNGIVSRIRQLPSEGRLACYQADVVPSLWLLSRTTDCRIFQNKSTPEIVQTICRNAGFTDLELRLQRTYEPREYCVQYQETTLNFLQRLLEDEGIFFFFRHEQGKHTLVLADSPDAHQVFPHQSTVHYVAASGQGVPRDEDVVFSWQQEHEIRPHSCTLTGFNFKTPDRIIKGNATAPPPHRSISPSEWYEYCGDVVSRPQIERLTRIRAEEHAVQQRIVSGASNVRTLSAGYRFQLCAHERRDQNAEYVVTAITYTAHEGGLYAGAGNQPATYSNTFTCMPKQTPFRPERTTAKLLIHGSQTAIVVGPAGENIYTDQYGRVKVQFHWDRDGRHDQNSSCWVRVSHPWAGKGWGAIFLPRIGQEVLVDFLEGDPDRPVITGRLYNGEQTPPYALPAHRTQSGIKSRSSNGGGPDNFNEIRFEDKKGQEELYVHAERQLSVMVEQDERRNVGANRAVTVTKDDSTSVGNNHVVTIGGGQTTTVAQARTVTVLQTDTLTVATTISVTAGGAISIIAGGPVSITSAAPIVMTTPVLKVAGLIQCTSLVMTPG